MRILRENRNNIIKILMILVIASVAYPRIPEDVHSKIMFLICMCGLALSLFSVAEQKTSINIQMFFNSKKPPDDRDDKDFTKNAVMEV